jgi:hypothetical protein
MCIETGEKKQFQSAVFLLIVQLAVFASLFIAYAFGTALEMYGR